MVRPENAFSCQCFIFGEIKASQLIVECRPVMVGDGGRERERERESTMNESFLTNYSMERKRVKDRQREGECCRSKE